MNTSGNITLLYEHPHISIYVTDNTGYNDTQVVDTTKSFNGIQVGFFGGGRDNTVMYCQSLDAYLNEFYDPNYRLYGQAGYNAYNVLSTNYAGMYILRLVPENMTHANAVVMAKYKLIDDPNILPPVTGNDVLSLIGTNPVKELIPSEENNIADNIHAFTLKGKVISGMSGDAEIDGLFSHITPEWLSGNNVGNFTVATVKIPLPGGIVLEDDITIRHTSAALKIFYSDFGFDAEHIVPNEDGVTATKERTYNAGDLLDGNDYITLAVLVAEGDTVYLDIDWGSGDETLIIKTTDLQFVEELEEEPVKQKLAIAFEGASIEGATSVTKLKAAIAELYSDEPDVDGYYKAPLMAFWALGRGSYGQNLRIKLSDANEYDGTFEPTTRMYRLDVLENTREGLVRREYVYGMIDEDAFDKNFEDGPSLYLPDMVNDIDLGSAKINMYFNPIVLQHMIELINGTLEEGSEDRKAVPTFDPFLGLTINGLADDLIEMIDNTADEGYINLVAADGFCLNNGDDGDFDTTKHTQEEIDSAKEELLCRAFEGEIDKRIKSRYSTPADFCLDANFPESAKVSMGVFANRRMYDCMTYLDTGLATTATEVINYLKNLYKINGNNIVKECHTYTYRDRLFTGKSCQMTITHWFAKTFPRHVNQYGIGEPFAREKAIINNTTFVSGTFLPVIDPDEHEIKAQIYKLGANCFETVKYNVFQRSSAITTYTVNSDRRDEFNEYIVHRAIKIAHNMLSSKLYHIAEESDRIRFTKDAEKILEANLSGLVRSCGASFEMTKQDEKKGILRLKLRMTFYTVAKYGVCEVYLDPRVVEAAV